MMVSFLSSSARSNLTRETFLTQVFMALLKAPLCILCSIRNISFSLRSCSAASAFCSSTVAHHWSKHWESCRFIMRFSMRRTSCCRRRSSSSSACCSAMVSSHWSKHWAICRFFILPRQLVTSCRWALLVA